MFNRMWCVTTLPCVVPPASAHSDQRWKITRLRWPRFYSLPVCVPHRYTHVGKSDNTCVHRKTSCRILPLLFYCVSSLQLPSCTEKDKKSFLLGEHKCNQEQKNRIGGPDCRLLRLAYCTSMSKKRVRRNETCGRLKSRACLWFDYSIRKMVQTWLEFRCFESQLSSSNYLLDSLQTPVRLVGEAEWETAKSECVFHFWRCFCSQQNVRCSAVNLSNDNCFTVLQSISQFALVIKELFCLKKNGLGSTNS